jgi:hypothetical protein
VATEIALVGLTRRVSLGLMSVSPRFYDEAHEKWRTWVDRLANHFYDLFHNRAIWREVTDAIRDRASDTSSVFIDHYTKMYVDASAMAVRRLADIDPKDKRAISLGRLITDIVNQPGVVSRERYLALYEPFDDDPVRRGFTVKRATDEYDDNWGDGSGGLDLGRVRADLDTLEQSASAIADFATWPRAPSRTSTNGGWGPSPPSKTWMTRSMPSASCTGGTSCL